jgi:hypothetical protein
MTEHLFSDLDGDIYRRTYQISDLIEKAALERQGDCVALLALLRILEQRHREIRETACFEMLYPPAAINLYALLRDIEVNGGWPYIQRMKLQSLFAQFSKRKKDETLDLQINAVKAVLS